MERALTVAREPLLVVVLGPTGSGKTALSLAIAEACQGEIVNCDSVAMYREFEIGTAKPSAAELMGSATQKALIPTGTAATRSSSTTTATTMTADFC